MAIVRSEADEIQREMANIRSQIHQEMRGVVDVATTATDWRSYFHKNPWLAVGIAFTSGYLLVPSRSRASTIVIQPSTPQTLSSPAKAEKPTPSRLSMMGRLLSVVGPIAVRAAQTYVSSYVENLLINTQSSPLSSTAPRQEAPGPSMRSARHGVGTRD